MPIDDRPCQTAPHDLPIEFTVLTALLIIAICLVNVLVFRPDLLDEVVSLESFSYLLAAMACVGVTSLWAYFAIRNRLSADMRIYRERLEISLRYEELFRQAVDNAPAGMALVSPDSGLDHVNRMLCETLGCAQEDLVGLSIQDLSSAVGFALPLTDIERLRNGEITQYTCEQRLTAMDGREIDVRVCIAVVRDGEGEVTRYVAQIEDITERKRAEEQVRYLSFHDKLTGLYNRAFFEEELQRLDTSRQLPISIVIGDVNGLKLVNDAFGHDAGDRLLVSIARLIQGACRSEDVVARWGGDEFVVLLPHTAESDAIEIAERIRGACRLAAKDPFQPSVSLGVSTKADVNKDAQTLLKEAEDRMYRSKLIESTRTRHAIIESLERSLWETDNETEEHVRRVQAMVVRMGKQYGFAGSALDNLSLLAALHDIGKIAIPRSILSKEGRLTEDEWAEIKKHPEIGYRITLSSPDLAPIGESVLSHHERWDGTGYPRGLAGEAIPIEARIVAVVDAFDVMTNGRPYRRAISVKEALDELRRCSGTQFDPEAVETFARMIGEVHQEC
jgi:diguanylate cyclase (GGDEF)-like protein/PAS domain S-box-containing protein